MYLRWYGVKSVFDILRFIVRYSGNGYLEPFVVVGVSELVFNLLLPSSEHFVPENCKLFNRADGSGATYLIRGY